MLTGACNRASCDGLHTPSVGPDAPTLTLVEMLPSQPDNPWGLIFAVSFEGGAGHVADGNLLIYTGAGLPASMPLQNAFAAESLDFAAEAGRVAVPLSLSQGGVQDDTIVRLGFQLEDAAQKYSNCYTLDIHVDISLAAATPRLTPTVLWAGACRRAPLRPGVQPIVIGAAT
jgi:hypothetical protein